MAKIIGDGAARVGITDDGMVSLETCNLLTRDEARDLAIELNRVVVSLSPEQVIVTAPAPTNTGYK